jgi:hypothetical protein
MDRHYIKPSEETLRQAMARYAAWMDKQFEIVDQTVDQEAVSNTQLCETVNQSPIFAM